MSATAIALRKLPLVRDARPQLRLVHSGPRNLAELIDTAWAGVRAEMPVACPICDGRMTRSSGAVAARCRSCGTELS